MEEIGYREVENLIEYYRYKDKMYTFLYEGHEVVVVDIREFFVETSKIN